jgi:hypothetical protein
MKTMTSTLPAITFLAVIAALVLAPVSAVFAGLAISAAGIFLMLAADYGRAVTPLRTSSTIIPFGVPSRLADDLRHAA